MKLKAHTTKDDFTAGKEYEVIAESSFDQAIGFYVEDDKYKLVWIVDWMDGLDYIFEDVDYDSKDKAPWFEEYDYTPEGTLFMWNRKARK